MIISLLVIALLIAIPTMALASTFGGFILSTTLPSVTCTAPVIAGPFMIRSSGGPVGPYVITTSNKRVNPSKWILGIYAPGMNSSYCHTDTDPPVPVPVYVVSNIFGVSR